MASKKRRIRRIRKIKRWFRRNRGLCFIGCGVILIASAVLSITLLSSSSAKDNIVIQSPLINGEAAQAENTVTEEAGVTADSIQTQETEPPTERVATVINLTSPELSVKEYTNKATFRILGDFVINDHILTNAKANGTVSGTYNYDFAPMLSYVSSYIGDADYTVANVDGPMGGKGKNGYCGYPQFNTPESMIPILKNLGVDMLTLSNNHCLDTYFDGFKAQIDNLLQYGMDYVGGAKTQEEHDTPVVREINGIKFGFLNYTHSTNTLEDHCSKDAVKYGINKSQTANYKKDAQKLRDAGAECIIAFMHWGEEYRTTPDSDQKSYTKKLAAAGVDIIMGGHPHVIQPTYMVHTTLEDGTPHSCLCVCSVGNFLSQQRKAYDKEGNAIREYTDVGVMYDFTVTKDSAGNINIEPPSYIPVYTWRDGVEGSYTFTVLPIGDYYGIAPEGMAKEDYDRMKEAYNDAINLMGTEISVVDFN